MIDLLQNSGKDSIFVHFKVNTLNLTQDVQILPNLEIQGWQNDNFFEVLSNLTYQN